MLEIIQFYVSGFWVWVGLTFGPAIIGAAIAGGFSSGFQKDGGAAPRKASGRSGRPDPE